MPLTLQLTLVSAVFVTVAVNATWFPSTTEPLTGATVTTMEGGGGGGEVPAPPPPQPRVHVPAARRAMKLNRAFARLCRLFSGRGRIPSAKQAKGQRKKWHPQMSYEIGLFWNSAKGLMESAS
jgi:hypothetical protein